MGIRKIAALLAVSVCITAMPCDVWADKTPAVAGAEAAWGDQENASAQQAEQTTDALGNKLNAQSVAGDAVRADDEDSPDSYLTDSMLIGAYMRIFGGANAKKRPSRIPVTRYAGKDYSLVFEARYYLRHNPDVDDLVHGDFEMALKHFVLFGMAQRRQAIATFDVTAYYANYPELRAELGENWEAYYRHYQTKGKALGYVGTGRTGSKASALAAKKAREAAARKAAEERAAQEAKAAQEAEAARATQASQAAKAAAAQAMVATSGQAAIFIQETAKVAEYARVRGMVYGNSASAIPCEDGRISCDRLIARALWNMGFRDQPIGGIANFAIGDYLAAHGFSKGTSFADIRAGSIVIVINNAGSFHCFAVASYDPATNVFVKYDEGSNSRIKSPQPFVEPWAYSRLVAVYNWP